MKPLLKLLLLTLAVLSLFYNTCAQPPEVTWAKFYPPDYSTNDFLAEVIMEEPDGGIVVVGNRRYESMTNPYKEVLVMRLKEDGELIWYKTFGGNKVDTVKNELGEVIDIIYTPWNQQANDMVMTPEGNYLITGFRDTTSNDAATPIGMFLLEISPDGEVIMDSLYYNGDQNKIEPRCIYPDSHGGYFIAGSIVVNGTGSDRIMMVSLKKNEEGYYQNTADTLHWVHISELGLFGYPTWVRPSGDDCLMAGNFYTVNNKNDIFLRQINKNRDVVWEKYFGTDQDETFTDGVIHGDYIYLVGYLKVPFGSGNFISYIPQIYVIKTDLQGNLIREKTYGGPSTNYGVGILMDVDGDLLVTTSAYDAQYHAQMGLLKVDAESLDSLWMQNYGSFYSSGITDLARTADFGYVASARASYTGTQDPRIYVMRMNSSSAMANMTLEKSALGLEIANGTPTIDVIDIVSDASKIYGIIVKLDALLHPSVGDLEVTLAHDGTVVTLVDQPVHSGENFIRTGLIDAAEMPLESGQAPYSGWFYPKEKLSAFLSHVPAGAWSLTITDHGTGGVKTTAVLDGWSLNLLVDEGSGTGIPTKESLINFGLEPIRPNPFNQEAIVGFRIAAPGHVRVSVFNQLGQLVGIVADEELPEGVHERLWQPSGLAPGTYFIRLESGGMISVRKAVLTR
jgi:subtilisin-like proprotein convertase family protein